MVTEGFFASTCRQLQTSQSDASNPTAGREQKSHFHSPLTQQATTLPRPHRDCIRGDPRDTCCFFGWAVNHSHAQLITGKCKPLLILHFWLGCILLLCSPWLVETTACVSHKLYSARGRKLGLLFNLAEAAVALHIIWIFSSYISNACNLRAWNSGEGHLPATKTKPMKHTDPGWFYALWP